MCFGLSKYFSKLWLWLFLQIRQGTVASIINPTRNL